MQENEFFSTFTSFNVFCATLGVLCTLILWKLSYSRSSSTRATVLVVLGSGGHTSEMLKLLTGLSEKYYPRYYIVANTDNISKDKLTQFEEKQKHLHQDAQHKVYMIPRSREVRQSWISTVFTTFYASLCTFPIVFRIRPDLVLCNGPGTCIPVCLAALLLKMFFIKQVKIVYVESICRVDTLSLSGKILYYLADHVLVQWQTLKTLYPRTKYIGRIM